MPDADLTATAAGVRSPAARRAVRYEQFTIGYNVIEGCVAVAAGVAAGAVSLVGFGVDSVIEVCSAAAVAWQFAGKDPESREKAALRVIAATSRSRPASTGRPPRGRASGR